MPAIGTTELIIILVIVLLLFGGKKLPELAKSVGTSLKEIRKGVSDSVDDKPAASTARKDA